MKDLDKLNAAAEEFYPEILSYCRGRVPPEDAGDIAQDVFAAFTSAWLKKPIEYPRQWLYKAAKDRIADYYRLKKRQSRVIAGSLDEKTPSGGDEPDDDGTGPVYEISVGMDDAASPEDIERLARAILSALDADERRLYDLRFDQGLTYSEISAKEGITLAAVRHRLGKIKNKLRPLIKKAADDGRI